MALLLIIIAPNGHILANIAIVSQFSLAIDLSSKGLPGQLRISPPQRFIFVGPVCTWAFIMISLESSSGPPDDATLRQCFVLSQRNDAMAQRPNQLA